MGLRIGFVLFTGVFLLFFSAGLYNFLTDYEENRCNMTYMYMYPQLIRISLPVNVTAAYKKYGLYAYSEGKFIEKTREMKFTGIPVLFIPGNRGSPKQVRSLASVSLRKSLATRSPFHFDYFAIDLNEDLNALFGGFLEEQTKFVKICMSRILSLYREESQPSSIVLIGHSIGGVIAKGLFLEPGFDPSLVKIIITLATPHMPAILPDLYLAQYYEKVNNYWDNSPHLKEKINFLSIGGGPRDLLVRTNLTVTPHADISVVTSLIPEVWLSVDHLCILWCRELIIVIVRSLFDSVDLKTKQITDDVALRKDIFEYHFLERSGSKRFHSARYPSEVILYNNKMQHSWIPMVGSHMTWFEKYVDKTTHITVSLATAADTLAVLTENHENRDWIFACVVDTTVNRMRICKTATNLSGKAKISLTSKKKRKSALIDLSHLRMTGYSHVVIRTLPNSEEVKISLDLFKKRARTIEGSMDYLPSTVVLEENSWGALYYAVEMSSLQKIWQTYVFSISSKNCTSPDLAEVYVNVPWNHEGSKLLINGSSGLVPVFLHSSKPVGKDVGNVKVEFFLNHQCAYRIKLSRTFLPGISAVISKQGISVFTYVSVCLLLTLAYQIKSMKENLSCPLLHTAMPLAGKPYIVMQASAITTAIAQHFANYIPFIPSIDTRNNSGMIEMLVIPVALYLVAFCLTYIVGLGLIVGIVFQGQAYNGIILKFLSKFFFGLAWLSEYALSGAIKVPLVVSAFMMTVAYTACGGLAVCIGLGFYCFKMITLYEDFWEEIVYWPLRALKAKLKQRKDKSVEIPTFQIPSIDDISFHLTLLMLWTQVAIINVPSVLVWAKNYRYSSKLDPDPGYINCVILTICAGVLWQSEFPRTGLAGSKTVSHFVFTSAVLVMIFAQTSLYRLSTIITVNIALVTLHQIIAPWFTKEINEEDEPPELVGVPEEGVELKSQLAEIFQGTDLATSLVSEIKESKEDGQKNEDTGEKDGEITPSSDTSTSSFEQISEKEV
ncbi:GPI inositol-deacylase isoform X2 [Cimex lectularius]|uniref:GPI inositol-deacylase n=1 Tax=Cimex lectularius TaxID=79782 RepID=A0A8I6RFI6_CIMLE|nr:GPI inositol-deacylase isoform X2 [Cimex lectularius]